ncbi:hypothetical protein [Paracoccus sp. (in: a-proteobacteria)]
MPEDYEKAFLRANAKAPFIGRTLADIVRRVMRASINNDGSQRYEAAEAIKLFLDLVSASEDIRLYDVIDQAVADLAVEREWDSYEADNLRIAEAATRYLLEMSCKDGFARGRASKRWNDVERGFRVREEMRAWRRRKWEEEYAAGKSDPKGNRGK